MKFHKLSGAENKRQADKANQAQVELHIQRQKELGELMIGDDDEPSKWDLLATVLVVGVVLYGTFRGWW